MQPRLLEEVRAHHEVREPVAAGVGPVRADPSDLPGEVKDELGRGVVEHARRVLHRREVVVAASGGDDVVAVALETLDEPGAQEATASRDEDATHGCFGSVPVRTDPRERLALRNRR